MICEEYKDVFIEGELYKLKDNILIGHNFYDDGYKIYHNCACHYGVKIYLRLIDIDDMKYEDEYITIDAEEESYELLEPLLRKYINNFDECDDINLIKSATFIEFLEETKSKIKELKEKNKIKEANFLEAFIWYFVEHKKFGCCTYSRKILNIIGY